MRATVSAASRITGIARATLERWIDMGWLPTEEFLDGRNTRALIDLADIPAARETSRRAPHGPVNVWLYDGAYQATPRPGTKQHKQLHKWLRSNTRRGRLDFPDIGNHPDK